MEENLQRLVEWDENKNRLNKIKHGVDFRQAAKVFEDSFCLWFIPSVMNSRD